MDDNEYELVRAIQEIQNSEGIINVRLIRQRI